MSGVTLMADFNCVRTEAASTKKALRLQSIKGPLASSPIVQLHQIRWREHGPLLFSCSIIICTSPTGQLKTIYTSISSSISFFKFAQCSVCKYSSSV